MSSSILPSPAARTHFAPAASPKTGPTRHHRPLRCLGEWQLCKLAGCGSFTDVFFARPLGCRPDWPADYAVKVLRPKYADNPAAVDLLRREAEVGSEVSHRHLVTILEANLSAKEKYLVMPRLDGVSIGQIIERAGHLSVRQSLWILRQVTEALDALHQNRWLHGDLKPDNIMFSSRGHATLIDLGFAMRFAEATITETRVTRGTFNFIAPETLTSAYGADQRSDIYSLGIAFYNMLTGQLPFHGNTPGELIEAHREQPLPDPRNTNHAIPTEVVRLLSRMTAKAPLRRPQSARGLVEELLPLELTAMKMDRTATKTITRPLSLFR